MYDNKGKELSAENIIKGKQSDRWSRELSNELGRLDQGNDFGVLETDTI